MKHFTKLMMLALVLLTSVTAWGRVAPGDAVTDLSTLKGGDRIFVKGSWHTTPPTALETPHWLSTPFPSRVADSVSVSVQETVSDAAAWELEDAGTTYTRKFDDGTSAEVKGFYVKSVRGGKYLNAGAPSGSDYESVLYLQDAKSTVWYFSDVVYMDYTEEDSVNKSNTAPENAKQMFALASDGTVMFLNNNYQYSGNYVERISTWSDSPTWHEIDIANEDESLEGILEDINSLYTIASSFFETLVTGTNPGYCSQEAYDALDEAMANANDDSRLTTVDYAEQVYNALLDSYLTAKESVAPMSDGYYWVVNCDNDFYEANVGLYTKNGNEIWWGAIDNQSANYIWKFTKLDDGTYEMRNYATDQVVNSGDGSTAYTAKTSTTNVTLAEEFSSTAAAYCIKVNGSSNSEAYKWMHALNHGNGASSTNICCLWAETTTDFSGWRFVKVPEDIVEKLAPADEEKQKAAEYEALTDSLSTLISNIRTAVIAAIDVDDSEMESVLPTPEAAEANNYEDFFSNAAMSAEHGYSWGDDGNGYKGLIDDDDATFFHSSWVGDPEWSDYDESGTGYGYATSKHNLGAKLTKAVDNVYFYWKSRAGYADVPVAVDVEASNDGTTWTRVATGYNFYDVPNTAGCEAYAGPIDLGGSYQYVRFASWGSARGSFFDIAAWNVYTGVKYASGAAISAVPAETRTALFNAYYAARVAADTVTVEDNAVIKTVIADLTDAYSKFNSSFVDPTELKTALANAQSFLAKYIQTEGTVGTYNEQSDTTALSALVEDAINLIAEGGYSAETISAKAAALNEAVAGFSTYFILPDPNKWYKFQFASAEEYEKYKFSSDSEVLVDRVVSVTKGYDDDLAEQGLFDESDDIPQADHKVASIPASDADAAPALTEFRFIAVGDSGYVLQNKATGLFVPHLSTSGTFSLGAKPGVFTYQELGYGFSALLSHNILTGEENGDCFHFGNKGSLYYIVGWTTGMSTKSAFHITEVEDVDVDEIGSATFTGFQAVTWPETIVPGEGVHAYTAIGRVVKEDGTTYIAMKEELEKVPAGTPVLLAPEDPEASYKLSLGTDFVTTAATTTGFKGGFTSVSMPGGSGTLDYNTDEDYYFFKLQSASGLSSTAYGTYLDMTEIGNVPVVTEDDADLLILINNYNATVGLNKINTVAGDKQNIYTIDGVKVNSDVKSLKKGLYIINGKKVLVY